MLALSQLERREREIKTDFLCRMGRELDARKAALARQLDEINSSLSQLWGEYGVIHNSGAYANRIPTETLCVIFSYCLNVPKHGGDDSYVYQAERPSPEVVLSHVCRHWRNVAIHDPALWRFFRYKTLRWRRDPISRFNTYMQRSNPTTIDLFIHLSFLSHEDLTLLNAAALQVHRWRRVTIFSEDNKFNWSQFQRALAGTKAANLEYFLFRPNLFVSAYTNDRHIWPISHLTPKIFKRGAPKLTRIYLDSTVPYFFLPPVSNVTALSLEPQNTGPCSITWSAFLDILAIPSLISLSIGGEVILAPSGDAFGAPIEAKTLQHLRWSNDRLCLDYFLPFLSAPKLETLVLCRMPLPPRPSHPDASVSLPALRHLYIAECAPIPAHYIRLLATGCPNITHLYMSYQSESGHLLENLNREFEGGRSHWMDLESVTGYTDGTDSITPYLTFTQPRKREGHSLTLRVSNRLHKAWSAQFPDEFLALKNACDLKPSVVDFLPLWPPNGKPNPGQNKL